MKVKLYLPFLAIFSLAWGMAPDSSAIQSMQPGSKSIEVNLESFFSLREFEGASIAIKKFRAGNKALRYGIGIGGSIEELDKEYREREYWPPDTLDSQRNTTELYAPRTVSLTVLMQIMKYYAPSKDVSFFYGIGPRAGFYYMYIDEFSDQDAMRDISREKTLSDFYGGFAVSLGIEWFFQDRISFRTEYFNTLTLGIQNYRFEKEKTNEYGLFEDYLEKHEKPYMQLNSVLFSGFSFYFR